MSDCTLRKQATRESSAFEKTSTENPFKMKEWTEQPRNDPEEENWDDEEDRGEDLEEVAGGQQLSDKELTELIEVEEVRGLLYVVLWRSLTYTQKCVM